MGYIEVYCQLCGVPFAINRIRTRHEPRETGYANNHAYDHPGWCEEGAGSLSGCPPETCSVVYRGHPQLFVRNSYLCDITLYEDDPEDQLYEYKSDTDSEPLEYDSDASSNESDHSPDMDVDINDGGDLPEWTFRVRGPPPPEIDTEFLPLATVDDLPTVTRMVGTYKQKWHTYREYEHIAGPDCERTDGYHGHRISAEEMRGCRTVQCLVQKRADWQPRDDDMPFEKDSKYQLTGLADRLVGDGRAKVAPVRNGVDRIVADNPDIDSAIETAEEIADSALPFHPTCFELFMIASESYLDDTDIDGLVRLRNSYFQQRPLERPFCEYNDDVEESRAQVWGHHIGLEYLAANPIFIPGFREICEAAISDEESFSVQQSPFPSRKRAEHPSTMGDPFLRLPTEIILKIVRHLWSKDIAALRLASHAFEHLPISLWYRLCTQELPFVYEAWLEDPKPYLWTYLDASCLLEKAEDEYEFEREYEWKRSELEEIQPELLAHWDQIKPRGPPAHDTPEFKERMARRARECAAMEPIKVPYAKTNWYQLYRDIVSNWDKLQGLQNRERIWADVVEIVHNIKDLRRLDATKVTESMQVD